MVISIPIVVHTDYFKWQTDLFWFNHCMTYADAEKRVKAVVIRRNMLHEERQESLQWPISIPHMMCESTFDYLPKESGVIEIGGLAVPLNIQIGLLQMIDQFDDEQILEVNDSDMFHFRAAPEMDIADDELHVCALYEEWHLKSLSEHKNVIEPYFKNGGGYYNGGFVPILGKAKTFRKILQSWIDVHIDILKQDYQELIKWWAGMYALQIACEQHRVKMVAKDYCYVPGLNTLAPHHYICHYTIDGKFNKKSFPDIDVATFEDNLYFDRIVQWLQSYYPNGFPPSLRNIETKLKKGPAVPAPAEALNPLSELDSNWHRWLVRHLSREMNPDILMQAMIQNGVPQEVAQGSVHFIMNSPIYHELRDSINETKTREWLLGMLDSIYRRGGKYSDTITRIKPPKFKDFLKHYYFENVPVVLNGAAARWKTKRWTPQMLKERVGNPQIEVQFGRSATPDYEREAGNLRRLMHFGEYVDLVLSTERSNDFYMTAGNWEKSMHGFAELYQDIGNVADGYLDSARNHENGYLWLGPAGTLTPLHHDLTNNLFVQVYGYKRFILIPSHQVPHVYNNRFVFSEVDIFNIDYERFPDMRNVMMMDFVLAPGDALFIPNCWLHAVEALDTSISLTFTNFNTPNFHPGYPGQQRYM